MNQNIRPLKNKTALFLLTFALLSGLITTICNSKTDKPNRVIAELNIGESQQIMLQNGDEIQLRLLAIDEERDACRGAIRGARIKITVDGEAVTLNTGNYNLPVTVGKVKIDCPVIKGYYSNSKQKKPCCGGIR